MTVDPKKERTVAERTALLAGLDGKLAEHDLSLGAVLGYDPHMLDLTAQYMTVALDSLPAHVALDVAWWLNSVGLRHTSGTFQRMHFTRQKDRHGTDVRLHIDTRMSVLQAIADAALSLREAMEAGDVNAACERFGFTPVVDYTSGKKGRAYKTVADQANYSVHAQQFGQIDQYTDRPHTLTLATLLSDAVARGEGKTRSTYASAAEKACAVLNDTPDIVDVAVTLDHGVTTTAPPRLSVKVAKPRTVTAPKYAKNTLNLPRLP